jgi:nicotinate-nucleotide pyrophosphorylase
MDIEDAMLNLELHIKAMDLVVEVAKASGGAVEVEVEVEVEADADLYDA